LRHCADASRRPFCLPQIAELLSVEPSVGSPILVGCCRCIPTTALQNHADGERRHASTSASRVLLGRSPFSPLRPTVIEGGACQIAGDHRRHCTPL
jgi:hypothetical protein